MSLPSIDHVDDEIAERAYKGYHIDNEGEVTEFYDHRDEDTAASSQVASSYQQPIVSPSNGYPQSAPTERIVKPVIVVKQDAGCCNSCVGLLTTIGTLPIGTTIAALFCLAGTAMFIAGGWSALDETMVLFKELGPNDGNPATDKAPQCLLPTADQNIGICIPRDLNNLGNRFPQVVQSIKYSFYGIIPFMFIFIIMLAADSQYGLKTLRSRTRNCKTSSSGICMTASLIACCYIVMLAWIFWLCFVTLGVYYYRITMLRCYDLNDREFSVGVQNSVCIDLVQLGVIMFQNTNDEGFGKICGPSTTANPTHGDLVEYCKRYPVAYNYMIIAFSGCLLVILGMVDFIVILTSNYAALTHKKVNRHTGTRPTQAYTAAAPSTVAVSLPPQSIPSSAYTGPPARIRGTRDQSYPDDDYKFRRSSKDIELDYLIDSESSTAVPRRRELDSNVGVNYYYKDRRQY